MKYITTRQMQKLEGLAEKKYGISTLVLMENAGRSIADQVSLLARPRGRILVLCGGGNNGGDGFVAARHLCLRGFRVRVVHYGRRPRPGTDPAVNYAIIRKMRLGLDTNPSMPLLRRRLARADWVVDALFGTGLKRPVEGLYAEIIRNVNAARRRVLAVDTPSGLDADSGRARGVAVRATCTVTLGHAKKGLRAPAARGYVGRLCLGDISLP